MLFQVQKKGNNYIGIPSLFSQILHPFPKRKNTQVLIVFLMEISHPGF